MRAGFGGRATHAIEDSFRRFLPADATVIDGELRSERGLTRLGACDGVSCGDGVDDLVEQTRSHVGEPGQQLACGLPRLDPDPSVGEDVAGVELRHESEHGGAGDIVARDECVLHRCRTAPLRQQAEVEVDPSVCGSAQQRFPHEPAVGDDDAEIGLERRDPLGRVGVQTRRLDDRCADLLGRRGNRRRGEHPLAS